MIKVTCRKQDEITILDLEGSIDLEGVDALKEAISRERQAGCTKLVLNMEKVASILSTILNRFQPTVTAFWAPGGRMVLINTSTGNLRILEKTQFSKMLMFASSEEEAIQKLKAS
ncbi:MAG: STAS domain-containing protein [bacterium]